MKLKNFNQHTFAKQNGSRDTTPRVTFGKAGTIHFNKTAADLIGITVESKLTLSQDEEHPEDWYFFLDEATAFPIRAAYDKKGFLFNHQGLVKKTFNHFGLQVDKGHGFLIAGTPTIIKGDKTKYWGLIVLKK